MRNITHPIHPSEAVVAVVGFVVAVVGFVVAVVGVVAVVVGVVVVVVVGGVPLEGDPASIVAC